MIFRKSLRLFLAVSFLGVGPLKAEEPTASPEWPLRIDGGRAPIVMYQPQPETFKDDKLTARAAVSIQPSGKNPVFGAIWLEARVDTDRDARTVTVRSIKVTQTRFPNAVPEKEQLFSQILTEELTQRTFVISLDRLLVSLENAKSEMKSAENLNNTPPKIYIEKQNAILVVLDGEPQLSKIADSKDMRVVNTPFELTFVTASKSYRLKAGEQWLKAPDWAGPWTAEVASSTPTPKVILSKEPAELIVSQGEPVYTPLPGNNLLYMSNSESQVFIETATSKFFVLLSGRWFTAAQLEGPWTFVKPDALPAAFAKIPPDSPKAAVLASIAGTQAAQEAVLDAQIPQTAVVSRKEKDGKLQIQWDGEPQFKEVGSSGIAYSLNASGPVFRVKDKGYWACDNAVWYASKKPTGPWVVASYVPEEIYDIPPDCPYYNTRYVQVYESTPDVVYVGYYPGYVGSYPYYGTVVYGTGYYYHGWYGPYYHYPPPMVTWGFAFSYNPYSGWGAGVYWGPGYGYPGYGGGVVVRPPGGGWWGPGGYHPRPTPYNNNGAGQINSHDRQNLYNKAQDFKGNHPNAGANRPSTKDNNNVFADREGNIHRPTKDGGWQQQTREGWKDSQAASRNDLQRDRQARDRGAQRASQYSAGNMNRGGGGYRGGGGGMRGGGRR